MKQLLKVVKKGVFSSLQDNGRYRYRRFGIPTAGPMDQLSFELGKKILGNKENSTALEIFYGGVSFLSLAKHEYVLVGADMKATVNGKPIEPWKTFILNVDDLLELNVSTEGSIAYLMALGGFNTNSVLNSTSTYLKANLGTVIKKDTILYGKSDLPDVLKYRTGLYKSFIPNISDCVKVRVTPSYHLSYFIEEDVDHFFQSEYQLTNGDRMGYYLQGPLMRMKVKKELLSEPTMFGTIQIPPNGQPIILMADAQTVGGYPTVGKVVEEDLWKVAQLRYGNRISFEYQPIRNTTDSVRFEKDE